MLPSGCAPQKPLMPASLPPGFEQSEVPNVDLDGFLYFSQDKPFTLSIENANLAVNQLYICLSPVLSTEALWLKGVFSSPSEAKAACQSMTDSENIWKLCQEYTLFIIHSHGFTAESLVTATTQNDFVVFGEAYPDVRELINRLPTDPLGKTTGTGFLTLNGLQSLFKDEQSAATLTELLDKAKIETIVIGFYSKTDLDLITIGELDELCRWLLLVGKSPYPGLVISPVLPQIGMTEDYIDGKKVYSMSADGVYLMLKNVGSYIYLSIAPGPEKARELLRTALAKLDFVSLPAH